MNQALIDWLTNAGWQLAGYGLLFVLPFAARYGISYLRTQAHSAKLDTLFSLAAVAVKDAEQAFQGNPVRKAAALAFVQQALDSRSIHLPVAEIDAAIESAVFSELDHTATPADTAPKP